ncbi:MAG: AAA family ATPase [Nitrososphaerota archaeon]|nr:AAA family ATPase [Candidatus Bathyarchaeota archaeon]MCX8162610.1 AAA family ATPase [Candidatus Bathyarchaeota archaeon]MDW8061514.1 AAA family ATPase [Nitrososphaerota archaeon]
MIVLGLAGLPGSGKTTIAKMLESRGWRVVNMGDYIRREALRRGLKPTRGNLSMLARMLREEMGADAIARLCIDDILSSDRYTVVDGLRSPSELDFLKDRIPSIILVFVEAPIEKRFTLLSSRGRLDDPKCIDDLIARDRDEAGFGLLELRDRADYLLVNDGGLKELEEKLEAILRDVYARIDVDPVRNRY